MKTAQRTRLDLLIHSLVERLHLTEPGYWEPSLKNVRLDDLHVLVTLFEAEDARMKDLRARFPVPSSTMTGILDRLEKGGLILRTIDDQDKRSFKFAATHNGRTMIAAHTRAHTTIVDRVIQLLGETDVRTFVVLLEKLDRGMAKGPR